MIETIKFYLEYPFVQYALIVSVLISICSALLGVVLVLKRFSFIGDSLSHVAFSIMAISSVLNLSNKMYITLPGTILATIILLNNKKQNVKKNDAQLAVVSVASLAIGYFIMNVFNTKANNISADVCTTLFGSTSILTLSKSDVILCVLLTIITITSFVFLFNKIFAITFDENFARSSGIKVNTINFLFSIIIGIIIVLSMNLVGSLLITALIVFPALTSMKVFNNFKIVIISSVMISIICTIIGLFTSILLGTPVGSTIVITNLGMYIVFSLIRKIGGINA